MADNSKSNPPAKLQEEPILARLQSGPGQTPTGVTSFVGLLGRSPKQGYWLLYLTLDMTKSVEIQETDIIHSEQLPADKSPFGSLGGTRVFVKQNAPVTTTQSVSKKHDASAAADEFDLDIQLGAKPEIPKPPLTVGLTCDDTCPRTQCDTCPITRCATCKTCNTHCGQHTCAATCQTCNTQCGTCPGNTCNTQCGTCPANTCNTQCGTCPANTCHTQCGTCQTCLTLCNQKTCPRTHCDTCVTCNTCDTCNPHIPACRLPL
jgi:hypothetical protein